MGKKWYLNNSQRTNEMEIQLLAWLLALLLISSSLLNIFLWRETKRLKESRATLEARGDESREKLLNALSALAKTGELLTKALDGIREYNETEQGEKA